MSMDTVFRVILVAAFLVALAIGAFNLNQITALNRELASMQASLQSITVNQASTTVRVAQTQQEIAKVASQPVESAKSQDQLLTSAVAKTVPAVVSIVISKDVPNLQVTYLNPFGNDPLFKAFGVQIPVYQQKGSTLQKVGAGSGFIISHDGYILTNKHVVADSSAEYTVLLSTGAQKPAKVVYRDPNNDVAVLKINGDYPTVVNLGDSSSVKLGQTVMAIGNALGEYSNSVSVGIISGLNRSIQATDVTGSTEQLSGVLQTDASINLGNSGGPLIDLSGNVIGINVATVYGSSNISFAIPINAISPAIKPYI